MSSPAAGADGHAGIARLSVLPADALIDVPRRITVEGLQPQEVVRLDSRTVRGAGQLWRATGRWRADAQGRIDLDRDAPLADEPGNSYEGVSADGLLWAQRPEQADAPRELFAAEPAAPLETQLSVWRASGPTLQARLVQRLAAPGVTRREVREDGLVGVLYTPATPGPHPVVVVLNGSNGGLNEPRAALYASRGYAALALAYFRYPQAPGLSPYISATRLEYFETALAWVRRTLRPRDDFVALSGQSRGGELVLLLASLLPEQVSAVVAYVPSALVHPAQNACDPATGRDAPAWLWRGQPLPHHWEGNRTATWAPWDEGPEPRRHANAMLTALADADAVARGRIRIERARCPLLLISGGDDGAWPSSRYARMVVDGLAASGYAWPVEHLDYPQAGHAISLPGLPATHVVHRHPVSGRLSTHGGTPEANAQADAQSWPAVRRFLDAALAARASPARA